MNLHNIVGAAVSAINPWLRAQYQESAGYTTNPDGTRVPAFTVGVPVLVQKQPLLYRDLAQVAGINLNGELAAIYVSGSFEGVARPDGKGGDLISLPDSSAWLVVHVLENWYGMDGWCKVACTRQMAA